MNDRRAQDLTQFYELLAQLERKVGARRLSKCNGHMDWPRSGIYFFREAGESRNDAGVGQHIVRVGTHTSHNGNGSLLWRRLRMHRGNAKDGGGNHRGSIFRLIIGAALIKRDGWDCSTWGQGNKAPKKIKEAERPLEMAVSTVIADMPFLWLATEDEPWPQSLRKYIERNAIALLSNYGREAIDPPSDCWLGHYSDREKVKQSSLWNSDHVDGNYEPAFLHHMQRLIERMRAVDHGR